VGKVRRITALVIVVWIAASPGSVVAQSRTSNDVQVTPERSTLSTGRTFTGILEAPAGEEFFNPPTPIPGRPGDVIWATQSPQACADLFGTPNTGCNIPLPIVRGTSRTVEVWRVLLHSLDRMGRPRAVSAVIVADPETAADSRVLLTQHGWAGMGDKCGIIGSRLGGGFAALGNAVQNYLSDGWVLVAPSAPGASAPGLTTSMVSGDSARSLIDATWATHLFTGARPEVVMHGHSVGGMMVSGVGGVAQTYAPELTIRGLVMNAAYGLTGPGVPGFDRDRGQIIDKPFSYEAAVSKAGALALVAQYSQAFAPKFKATDYLTKTGLRYMRTVTDSCAGAAISEVSGMSWRQLFKRTLEVPDQGSISRLSTIPTWFIVADGDEIVDPLISYHAYQALCRAGQPTYLSMFEGRHGSSLSVLNPRDSSGLKSWINRVARGEVPDGSCTSMQPMMASWYLYTASQLASAFGVDLQPKDKVTADATGSCRGSKQGVITVKPGGTCSLTIKALRGRRAVTLLKVSVQTRE
jgi:hypothetical protein